MSWDPNKYNNSVGDDEYVFSGEEVVVEPAYGNYGPALPARYVDNMFYDPEKRVVVQGEGANGSSFSPKPLSVFDIQTNPVEYLDTRLPLPVAPSPARNVARAGGVAGGVGAASTGIGNFGAALIEDGNVAYCSQNIPSKELRQVREDLGAEMADYGRWGRGPGGGVSLGPGSAVSGTQYDSGPVPVSSPRVSAELYDQGFISLSGVPVISAGKFKNPLTGVEYETYESALPPPDADYEETLTAPARNVKLAHLQGGWTDNTPRPTKVELVEDDFHMQYDRSIRTFGTYDPSRYVEMFERTNRFTRNDEHPDPDGPELVGVPANMDGNQNVKIRPLPYLPPTHRGKWGETTFRSGVDARVAVGNSAMAVSRTYTHFPKERLENTRSDGGGMEVTLNTSGFMDTQMGGDGGRRDLMPTQRSTTEDQVPYVSPASYVRLNANTGVGQYEVSTGDRGTTLVSGEYGGQYGVETQGSMLMDGQVEPPTGFSGSRTVGLAEVGGGVQPTVGTEGAMMHDQMLQKTNSQSGTTMREDAYGSYGGSDGYGQNLAQSQVTEHVNSKSGVLREDAYGSFGGEDGYGQQQTYQELQHMLSKSGVVAREDAYGSFGGADGYGQNLASSQELQHMMSKSGVSVRQDAYGSFGGEDGAQLVPSVFSAQDLTKRENYLSVQTAGSSVMAGPTMATRSRFNSRKGPLIDFLMPSGSMSGTDGFAQGIYGDSTSLNTKKEAQYGANWGFCPQTPPDATVYYGAYNQTMEHLNTRPYGNMEHLVAPATYSYFMQQIE